MRELKFRAWSFESMMYFETPDSLAWFSSDNGRSGPARTLTECKLMQYTGLKDKNGKEIYEGDICIVSLSYFKIKNEKATVVFHNGAFQFQYGCEKFFSKPHGAWDEVEVIGNIYENQELTEVK